MKLTLIISLNEQPGWRAVSENAAVFGVRPSWIVHDLADFSMVDLFDAVIFEWPRNLLNDDQAAAIDRVLKGAPNQKAVAHAA